MRFRKAIIIVLPIAIASIAMAIGLDYELQSVSPIENVTIPPPLRVEGGRRAVANVAQPVEVTSGSSIASAIDEDETQNSEEISVSDELADSSVIDTSGLIPISKATPRNAPTPIPDPVDVPESNELAALRELAKPTPSDGRIYGIRSNNTTGVSTAPLRSPTARPEATPTETGLLARVGGQFRGYSLLALMHPNARAMAEGKIATLLQSELQDLYLGVLVDGTFHSDLEYLAQVVQRLTVDGRRLLITLYLTNGPTMRKFETTPIESGFNLINPLWFREMIQTDRDVRDRFIKLAQSIRPIAELNAARSGPHSTIAVVMLEDNLERYSFSAMLSLAHSVLGDSVDYMRNPCGGCFPGNDEERFGLGLELHDPIRLPELSVGDGLTLDGIGFAYPGEEPHERLSFDEFSGVVDRANAQHLRFISLWRGEWQGLGEPSIHPDDRIYQTSTPIQIDRDIELLRRGQSVVNVEASQ